MKDPNSAKAIEVRLKYDWIVLLFGSLCVLMQLLLQGEWKYFFALVGFFVLVEVSSVAAYRNLLNGEDGFHLLSNQTVSQQASFGRIILCMVFDFVALIAFSMIFLVKLVR